MLKAIKKRNKESRIRNKECDFYFLIIWLNVKFLIPNSLFQILSRYGGI